MNIEQTKGKNFTPKKTYKGEPSSKIKRADTKSDASESIASGNSPKGANVSLSGTTFKDEIAFTKNILGNTRQESLGTLKKIKQKINTGDYSNKAKAVRKKISSLVIDDLATLQPLISQPVDVNSSTISDARKSQLLENPEITKKVADNIIKDLQKL